MGAAPQRAVAVRPPHYERRGPEQTPLYWLVREHYARFVQVECHTGSGVGLPQFVKDELKAYLDCDILARDMLVAFSCTRRGICLSCGTTRMAEAAANLVDDILPRVPRASIRKTYSPRCKPPPALTA